MAELAYGAGLRLTELLRLRVQDLVIWGLTYRMFLGLVERMGLPVSGEGGVTAP